MISSFYIKISTIKLSKKTPLHNYSIQVPFRELIFIKSGIVYHFIIPKNLKTIKKSKQQLG